jgi:hypothetical protein
MLFHWVVGRLENDFVQYAKAPADRANSTLPRSRLCPDEVAGGPITVARAQLILPRADSGCGKVFYGDRRTADWHRIALDFWNRATGRIREGYRLGVYRCKRCGGFHIGQKRIESQERSDRDQFLPVAADEREEE